MHTNNEPLNTRSRRELLPSSNESSSSWTTYRGKGKLSCVSLDENDKLLKIGE